MNMKNIWKLFPLVLICCIIFFFNRKSSIERTQFFKTELTNCIVSKNNNWSGGRSYNYITDNGFVITLLKKDNSIQIGDSIVKKSDTNHISIYRKNNNKYQFYKNYSIND